MSIRHGISSEITETKKMAKARCRYSLFPQPGQTSEILQGGFQTTRKRGMPVFSPLQPSPFNYWHSDRHCKVINKMHGSYLFYLQEKHQITYNKSTHITQPLKEG